MTDSDLPATVVVTHRFDPPAPTVYAAFLDPATAERFLFATATGRIVRCDIDARVGGTFTIVDRRGGEEVAHTGEFLELDPPHRIVFTLRVDAHGGDAGRVSIDIRALRSGCQLTLTHEMNGGDVVQARTRQGWIDILEVADAVIGHDPPTCGVGIARHAVVPMKIGIMCEALAETFELHLAMLVPGDASRQEDDVYSELAERWRHIAGLVRDVASYMARQRDLPMADHDESAWTDAHLQAFERLVRSEAQLLALLRAATPHDERMLASMISREGGRE